MNDQRLHDTVEEWLMDYYSIGMPTDAQFEKEVLGIVREVIEGHGGSFDSWKEEFVRDDEMLD